MFESEDGLKINANVLEQLQEWNLIPCEGQYLCARGHPLKLLECTASSDGFVWRCRKISKSGKQVRTCNQQISLRKNTFFDRSRLSMVKLIAFSYFWLKNVTQDFIIEELSITRPTAVDWCNFCREVVYDGMVVKGRKIGGVGSIVEIDESKFGRRKYHRGHAVEGQWVFGGVERGTNKCFLVPVEKRDKETLLAVIKNWILPNTTIVSDFWKAYDCLSDEGYVHFKVNHSVNFKDPETQQHTNTIEGFWRHVKYPMPQYHRNKKFFSGYLAKFMFVRHCKHAGLDPLSNFFKLAGALYNPLNPYMPEEAEDFEIEVMEEE
ncbi:uncharacterized protein LOC118749988 [Rhagoletis pomonella]|nr:uncharacterized protein LOC118749988 [Rhagoletis pomonella]